MTPRLSLLWLAATLFSVALISSAEVFALACDQGFVIDQGQVIQVHPTGVDDAANLACALAEAANDHIPEVRMTPGTFYLGSPVEVTGFEGILSGTGKARTEVQLLTGMADCSGAENSDEYVAALKFRGGRPHIRWFSLSTQTDPCSGGVMDAMVHFTGLPGMPEACSNSVIYGTSERVSFEGKFLSNPENGLPVQVGPMDSLIVGPELSSGPSCAPLLLGTFTALRNEFSTSRRAGLRIKMGGAATVLVNANSFSGTGTHLVIDSGAQTATVTYNTFTLDNGEDPSTGLRCEAGKSPVTNCLVRNNEFHMNGTTWGNAGIVLRGGSVNDPIDRPIGAVIIDNNFYASGDWGYGAIIGQYVNGVVVQGNRFLPERDFPTGGRHSGLVIEIYAGRQWSILGNRGIGSLERWPGSIDIELGANWSTLRNNDGAIVRDSGEGNVIIED